MWNQRINDDVYSSLTDLSAVLRERANSSVERTVSARSLRVAPVDGELRVYNPERQQHRMDSVKLGASMTDWSFRQLCSLARPGDKAPDARWLQSLPPEIAAEPLNWALEHTQARATKLLFARNGDLVMRSATAPGYGRVFDADVVDAVRDSFDPNRWSVPKEQPKRSPTKLFSSDRSLYLFLVDFTSPLEYKRPDGGVEQFYRGVIIGNSEVGNRTLYVQDFLFWFTCSNRELWQVRGLDRLSIRHTKGAPRRFMLEMKPKLDAYVGASAGPLLDVIQKAAQHEVGDDEEKVIAYLRGKGFTLGQSRNIYTLAEQRADQANPRSAFGLTRAATEFAQTINTQDERLDLEARAGKLMRLAA